MTNGKPFGGSQPCFPIRKQVHIINFWALKGTMQPLQRVLYTEELYGKLCFKEPMNPFWHHSFSSSVIKKKWSLKCLEHTSCNRRQHGKRINQIELGKTSSALSKNNCLLPKKDICCAQTRASRVHRTLQVETAGPGDWWKTETLIFNQYSTPSHV